MELLILSQPLTVAPTHTLQIVQLLVLPGLKLIYVSKRGPWQETCNTYMVYSMLSCVQQIKNECYIDLLQSLSMFLMCFADEMYYLWQHWFVFLDSTTYNANLFYVNIYPWYIESNIYKQDQSVNVPCQPYWLAVAPLLICMNLNPSVEK